MESCVYIFMYWIVMPLAFPTSRHRSMSRDVTAVIIHIFVDRAADALDRAPFLSNETSAESSMNDPLDFTGKVVLVTGSSRGIGAEMIKAFGERGAQCVVNYVADAQGQNKADASAVAKELKEPLVIECDVTQPQQVEAMMKRSRISAAASTSWSTIPGLSATARSRR